MLCVTSADISRVGIFSHHTYLKNLSLRIKQCQHLPVLFAGLLIASGQVLHRYYTGLSLLLLSCFVWFLINQHSNNKSPNNSLRVWLTSHQNPTRSSSHISFLTSVRWFLTKHELLICPLILSVCSQQSIQVFLLIFLALSVLIE